MTDKTYSMNEAFDYFSSKRNDFDGAAMSATTFSGGEKWWLDTETGELLPFNQLAVDSENGANRV